MALDATLEGRHGLGVAVPAAVVRGWLAHGDRATEQRHVQQAPYLRCPADHLETPTCLLHEPGTTMQDGEHVRVRVDVLTEVDDDEGVTQTNRQVDAASDRAGRVRLVAPDEEGILRPVRSAKDLDHRFDVPATRAVETAATSGDFPESSGGQARSPSADPRFSHALPWNYRLDNAEDETEARMYIGGGLLTLIIIIILLVWLL